MGGKKVLKSHKFKQSLASLSSAAVTVYISIIAWKFPTLGLWMLLIVEGEKKMLYIIKFGASQVVLQPVDALKSSLHFIASW